MVELKEFLDDNKKPVVIVGLGYVGLPLAVEFSKIRSVIGYDIQLERILDLQRGVDKTLEVSAKNLSNNNLKFTNNIDDLHQSKIYVVTVPTPIDSNNQPDLQPIISATHELGKILKKEDLVIYESTVFPGTTEEVCVPILEANSGLTYNKDFYLGYSPERVNPGDKVHTIPNIVKVVSGSNEDAALILERLYSSIISAGIFIASSIKVAEAAKVIENTQRDLNIALMNELSLIFDLMNIDTKAVLDAANTKWNFLNFQPGLVGGHCIGVDPYYLTYKAQSLGYDPKIILAGRTLNDQMSKHIVDKLLASMTKKDIDVKDSKILVMGLTFKENCPDIRNSKVFDVVSSLKEKCLAVDVFDPWVDSNDESIVGIMNIINQPQFNSYDGIIVAVGHSVFVDLGIEKIKRFAKKQSVLFDVKSIFPIDSSDVRL
ncbi:nucleotide sugar dehydrogenase [Gammaproteobacteria bacterium]|nr:nucleotide sugar dehydrogenase [Gammaproteobacteria bacterium]